MFRAFFGVGVAFLFSSAAQGQDCSRGQNILEISDWSAQYFEDRAAPLEVVFNVKNIGTKPLTMISGSVWFYDELGREIVSVGLPEDTVLTVGQTAQLTQRGFGAKAARLVELQASGNVKVAACIGQALYSDGTQEEF